ncbi:hypothetical protein [Azospirillum thermophilum]|uniref:Uncharacterized protein n=1 Tax=Azospirillum thermophilum TaxID=2202148 RepID=A0A2S2CZF0_9PROT|nr:hypothetical protein [Azospirillum thermophilum]AWK89886.1 hypothetical protein DEW08_28105 [Azospirillum thermophilum]
MSGAAGSNPHRSFRYTPGSSANTFERLFSVVVTHTYYTQEAGLCRDLCFAPDGATAKLMTSLGLLFKAERTGFSVLVQRSAVAGLADYLRRQARDGAGLPEYWSRLTFLMTMDNPLFIGITALPIDTKPTAVNLYGNNMSAHVEGETAVLPPGSFMDAGALYPVVGAELSLTVPPDARIVTLADISGTIVHRYRIGHRGGTGDRQITIDLGQFTHGFYTIDIRGALHQPVRTGDYPRSVLYVPTRPLTMGVLDFLFTRPTPEAGGVYPLPPLTGSGPVTLPAKPPVYRLPFDARSTYWQYYVVSQDPAGDLEHLSIKDMTAVGKGTSFRQHSHPVRLPDGASAILFEAQDALPLRQKSPQKFRLTGQRRDSNHHVNDILVSRLPVAPPSPVWPAPDTGQSGGSLSDGQVSRSPATDGLSEIFVYV